LLHAAFAATALTATVLQLAAAAPVCFVPIGITHTSSSSSE
jgi:hypothetical protein